MSQSALDTETAAAQNVVINIRAKKGQRDLIDQAAFALGKDKFGRISCWRRARP